MEQISRQRYEAYKVFMRRHHEVVWNVCYEFARGNTARCEDMVQEVWIMVWLKFDQLHKAAGQWQQRVWVRKVTRAVLIDIYRKERGDPLSDAADLSEVSNLPEPYDNQDIAERIDELLSTLTADEQQLMQMRFSGYTAEEIASRLGIEANAVYQRINRIMKKLKRYGTRL